MASQGDKGAASAGFVKLPSGYFLLAIAGSNHGKQGIWFYESSDTVINSGTKWYFVDFFDPRQSPYDTCYGEPDDDCYVGASGALNLATDCSGKVYMLAMHGTSMTTAAHEFEYLQVFELLQHATSGKILPRKVAQQRDDLQLSALDDESFRWGGGSYVTRQGGLAILNHERRTNEGSNSSVRGHLYIDTRFIP